MSLLDQLKQALGPSGLAEIGTHLGTDPSTTSNAVNSALPMLLGALAHNASTPGGAQALDSALDRDHDGSVLDNVPTALATQRGIGGSILSHVLGGRQSTVANGLGQATGLDASKITSLLAMLAPIVMGALARHKRTNGLDAGGLASMLGNERAHIQNTAPALGGLMGMLDANNDGSVNAGDLMGMASKFMKGR